jgi:predicted MPP superfamily phosphohydrolase
VFWNVDLWLKTVSVLGFRVLMNESLVVKRGSGEMVVLGIPDGQAKAFPPAVKPDLGVTMSTLARLDVPRILLAHNPSVARTAAVAGVNLQISGHTHGGQFFPCTLFIYLFTRFSSGLFSIEKIRLLVGRGAGAWGPPLRIGAAPDIPVITLLSSKS